ncbi:hypothetical protein AMECASPLE_007208 [Ameca splendens]|uniref:Uncharacterized protein n=1 Tax=Ameca splendens TaxID=208324 RepID=A0ABV0XNL2_9TELE
MRLLCHPAYVCSSLLVRSVLPYPTFPLPIFLFVVFAVLCLFPSLLSHLSPPSSPHVVLRSISLCSTSFSLISRSHMVSPSGSLCVWCYVEFTGAPCSHTD